MADRKVETLKRLPALAGAKSRDVELLARETDEIDFPAGKVLIREGAANHSFYVIVEGEVDVTVDGVHRRELGPGEFFGEISMEGRTPATATVTCKSAVTALVMSHEQFRVIPNVANLAEKIDAMIEDRRRADSTSR